MQEQLQEIENYVRSKDFSLAQRRLLDLSYDINNIQFLQNAVNWSQQESRHLDDKKIFSENFESAIHNLLQQASKITSTQPKNETVLVDANKIAKTYKNGFFSLKPFSIQINASNIIGVVGENGNGKTTLLRCLGTLLSIDEGSLRFPDIANDNMYKTKEYVAFIEQRIPRWYGKLKDNLSFSASIAQIYGKENDVYVDFMLERFGLTKYANLTWNQISGGYRTRFEIARILLQKPQLIILDEPLANLDINAQQTILTDLRFMAKSKINPLGIIFSSQQLFEVEKVADKLVFIKNGTAVLQPTKADSFTPKTIIEVDTPANREALEVALARLDAHIQNNGGLFTITTPKTDASILLQALVANQIPIQYYRDITHSTRRLF